MKSWYVFPVIHRPQIVQPISTLYDYIKYIIKKPDISAGVVISWN